MTTILYVLAGIPTSNTASKPHPPPKTAPAVVKQEDGSDTQPQDDFEEDLPDELVEGIDEDFEDDNMDEDNPSGKDGCEKLSYRIRYLACMII